MTAVFIGGTGRSGTNITRQILAQNPHVTSPHFETRYTVDPHGIMPVLRTLDAQANPFVADEILRKHFEYLYKLARKNKVGSVVNKLIRKIPGNSKELLVTGFSYADWNLEAHFPGYERRLDKYVNHFSSNFYRAARPGLSPFSVCPEMIYLGKSDNKELYEAAKSFVCGNIESAIRDNGTRLYVEDNTFNLLYASTIIRLVPDAKFIHVRRNPLDVVASYCKQRWCPDSPQLSAKIVSDLLATIKNELSMVGDDRIITMTLEGLVEDSKTQIQRLCEFLNLEFSPEMIELDLAHGNAGRAKKEYTGKELAVLENIIGEHMSEFNTLRSEGV